MTQTIALQINNQFAGPLKKGYPLILKDAVDVRKLPQEEGALLRLTDIHNRFIGTGYYGLQNKGIGWVLTPDANEEIDTAFLPKIRKAIQNREKFFNNAHTTAFRAFNGEGDGIGGMTIDFFDGYYMVSWYSAGIYSFKEAVYEALAETVNYKAIYEKKRFDSKGQYMEQDDFVMGTPGEFPIIVKENGMNFAVNLNDGAMTGIFLDQREVRLAIRERYSQHKSMLNTFSYTGAFSVAASLGGATKQQV